MLRRIYGGIKEEAQWVRRINQGLEERLWEIYQKVELNATCCVEDKRVKKGMI